MKYSSNQRGFTVVELLVGVVIMALMCIGVVQIFSVSVQSYQYSQRRASETQQASKVFNLLIMDVANASAMSIVQSHTVPARDVLQYTIIDSTGNPISHTVSLGTGVNYNTLMHNAQVLTSNIIYDFALSKDAKDPNMITITLNLNSQDLSKTKYNHQLTTTVHTPIP